MKKELFETKDEFSSLETEKNNEDKGKNGDEKKTNNMALGMCLGAMAGSIGMLVLAMFGQLVWGSCVLSLGIVVGMLIGMQLPKK